MKSMKWMVSAVILACVPAVASAQAVISERTL